MLIVLRKQKAYEFLKMHIFKGILRNRAAILSIWAQLFEVTEV